MFKLRKKIANILHRVEDFDKYLEHCSLIDRLEALEIELGIQDINTIEEAWEKVKEEREEKENSKT